MFGPGWASAFAFIAATTAFGPAAAWGRDRLVADQLEQPAWHGVFLTAALLNDYHHGFIRKARESSLDADLGLRPVTAHERPAAPEHNRTSVAINQDLAQVHANYGASLDLFGDIDGAREQCERAVARGARAASVLTDGAGSLDDSLHTGSRIATVRAPRVVQRESPARTTTRVPHPARHRDSECRATMMGKTDRWALGLFRGSVLFVVLSYGVIAGMFGLFPSGFFASAAQGYVELRTRCGIGEPDSTLTWYYRRVPSPGPPPIQNTGLAQPGVNLVTEIQADQALCVKVMDLDGNTFLRWDIDWFTIWPDAGHVPERFAPRSRPGTHVNGAVLMEDGDLVFNFEHLGLVRLDRDGQVVWRLPYQTHHSIYQDTDGTLWVCGQREHTERSADFPNQIPPFAEDTILVVTPEGRIVREWSVPQLLRANGRQGLLHLGTLNNFSTVVSGDLTHLNHAEPFPGDLGEGFFRKGDVLVSLRNVNTVFAFNRDTGKITFLCTGLFVRQHDPHFVDGDTFSVFDNNNVGPESDFPQSRIALVTAPDQTVTTYFGGTDEHPFFSKILGRHQWLPNGHLLVTDSCEGRAFEIDRHGRVVWSYINYVGDGVVGIIEQVQRLPLRYARLRGRG